MRAPRFDRSECRALLEPGLQALGLAPAALLDPLLHYLELLVQWNAAYNLTAVRDPREMVGKHLLDSLAVLPQARGIRLIDVGCGAGLPGIPLMLAGACEQLLLLDSNGKKVRFCRHALAELGLTSRAEARQARVEDVPAADAGDRVISRAFASLADFVRDAGQLVAPHGELLAMKGRPEVSELQALPAGWRLLDDRRYQVPGVEGERCLLRCTRG